jgi:signal transduction histidine kinase
MEKEPEISEDRIDFLQKGYRAILELIDDMEELSEFQDKIDIPAGIDQIWSVFLEDIGNLIESEVCGLFLADEDTHEFVLEKVSPEEQRPSCQKEIAIQIESGIFPWVINRKKSAIIPSQAFQGGKTTIMLPLATVKRIMGVVLVITPIRESSITRENLKLLTMLSKQCSLVMENTLLYENLRKKHESLQMAQAQILQSEKLASIGRLTAGASHEILNPLNIISGHLQVLIMEKELNPRISRALGLMREQADRISKIVKSLLQFSRERQARLEDLQVNRLIEETVSLARYEKGPKHIGIEKDLDPCLPIITGDGENLSQVFLNLLSNAEEAMGDGGTLKISTRAVDREGPRGHKSIEIRFEDTGPGIPDKDLDKIFEPFFTTKEAENGTGLGLSISYGIISDHGGTIRAEGGIHGGTVFLIHLPVSEKKI